MNHAIKPLLYKLVHKVNKVKLSKKTVVKVNQNLCSSF